ncbi:MAG: hypothetical protein M0C28_30440 [Candidatus Moduliflexus flocculans]|nr:hypothetical protein [Candidatus Moduliflexus flocculans]
MGGSARHFRTDFAALKTDEKAYAKALERLGGAPLLSMIRYLLLSLAFLAGIGVFLGGSSVREGTGGLLTMFLVSLAMFSTSFLYVFSDRLVSVTLLSHALTSYPRELREARQQRKIFIIPAFMAIMTLLFAFSLSFLVTGHLAEITSFPAVWTTGPGFRRLHVVVVAAGRRSGTPARLCLYRSVVSEMDALSSAEKDLTRRTAIASVDENSGRSPRMVNVFWLHLVGQHPGFEV